jgi:hypothetical protein
VRALIFATLAGLLAFCLTCVALDLYQRLQEARALACAKESYGTDAAVEECYARYGAKRMEDF